MKAFYFVLTVSGFGGLWRKGTSVDACLVALGNPKEFVLYIGCCKDDTPDDVVENLSKCWNVNNWGGLNFYEPDHYSVATNSPEHIEAKETYEKDQAQAKEFFLGWLTQEIGFIAAKAKEEKAAKREAKAKAKKS